MENRRSTELNIMFSIVRFLAIFSIISAHINISEPALTGKLISALGSIGVTAYMIMSGYFYNTGKYSASKLLISKVKGILIPWLVMGTFAYLYNSVLGHKGISPVAWGSFLAGYKSYLYYLTMLALCYIIFYKRNNITLITAIVVNIASVYLTATGCLNGIIEKLHITNYLNIFNWAGYFAVGCMLRKVEPDKLFELFKRTRIAAVIICVLCYAAICAFSIQTGYFSYIGMPFQLIGVWFLCGVSTYPTLDNKQVHTMSNMTFGVYLIHMMIIGMTDGIYMINAATKLLSPVFVAAICFVLLYAGYIAAKLIHIDGIYCVVTGVRMKRNIKEK